MISLIVAAKRRPDLTREQFVDYWLNRHAPLVLSVPEFARHVKRYVLHPFDADGEGEALVLGAAPDYDGVGELWFDSHAAMVAAFSEQRYLEVIRPDEDRFLDRDACLSFVTRPHVQKELGA